MNKLPVVSKKLGAIYCKVGTMPAHIWFVNRTILPKKGERCEFIKLSGYDTIKYRRHLRYFKVETGVVDFDLTESPVLKISYL